MIRTIRRVITNGKAKQLGIGRVMMVTLILFSFVGPLLIQNFRAADELDIPDESSAYMEFLNSEAQARGGSGAAYFEDDDEDLEEETLLETPLDNIEPYQLFRNALLGMFFCG